jgi:hypothetical protein
VFRDLLPPEEINAFDPPAPQEVYTPFVVTWLLVFQRLNNNASLSEAVAELLHRFPPTALPEGKACRLEKLSSNTAAYSAARSQLDASVLAWAARRSFDSLSSCYPPSWGNRRVFILDGTSVTLNTSAALKQAFPPASNQHGQSHWPVLRLLLAHEMSSGLAAGMDYGPMYGPQATSESALARRLIPGLPAGSILLADRNFGIFSVAWDARQSGHDVLTRLTGPRFKSLLKKTTAQDAGRWRLCWRPSSNDKKSDPALPKDACVEGWLHEVDVGGGRMLLLFASFEASGEALAGLYKKRGDVETDIRDLKVTLGMGDVTGKSAAMVDKELQAALLAYNLANQVRRLAAQKAEVGPRRLSFAGTWALVKAFLEAVAEGLSGPEAEARFERLLRQAGQRKLPNRKEGRSYPREVLARNRAFPKRKRPGQQPQQ